MVRGNKEKTKECGRQAEVSKEGLRASILKALFASFLILSWLV